MPAPRHPITVRAVLLIAVAACAAPYHPAVPTTAPVAECKPAQPTPSPLAAPADMTGRIAEIRRELADLDQHLDALDAEIAAAAVVVTDQRNDAFAHSLEQAVVLERATLDMLPTDAPIQLRRIASTYRMVWIHRQELGTELGPKHQEMLALAEDLDWLRAAFDRQKQVEVDENLALRAAFGKLSATASTTEVYRARLRAQLEVFAIAAHTGVEPSDAPAAIRVPIDRAFDAARRIHEQSHLLGPKHPTMIQLVAERDDALAEIERAITAITRDLITALAAPPTKPPPFDPTKLARRVDLALRARELRAELAALDPH